VASENKKNNKWNCFLEKKTGKSAKKGESPVSLKTKSCRVKWV